MLCICLVHFEKFQLKQKRKITKSGGCGFLPVFFRRHACSSEKLAQRRGTGGGGGGGGVGHGILKHPMITIITGGYAIMDSTDKWGERLPPKNQVLLPEY